MEAVARSRSLLNTSELSRRRGRSPDAVDESLETGCGLKEEALVTPVTTHATAVAAMSQFVP